MHDRSDLLLKVRNLLEHAAGSRAIGQDHEADAFEQKADQLMTVYAIESFELDQARPATEREKPEVRRIDYQVKASEEVQEAISDTFWYLARHCRAKIGWFGHNYSKVVGYAADLDYLELMITNAMLQLVSNLAPKVHDDLSEYENFKAFKEAGYKWERIWELLHPGEPFNRSYCQRLLGQYREECRLLGVPQIKGHPDIYRRSYCSAFSKQVGRRLYNLEHERNTTTSQALVLHNREGELEEFFYNEFPNQRPPAPHAEGCQCDSCHWDRMHDLPEHASCKRPYCVQMRKPVRASHYRSPAVDAVATQAGRSAADKVDLSRRGSHIGTTTREIG